MKILRYFTFLLLVFASAANATPTIDWQPWSDHVFVQAQREHRFVLLDLEAVWCHWCHVMDAQTYSDTAVINLIREHYIAVKVDQDAWPDLANRYEDYGWPATIVYDGKAGEIVKRSGYLAPTEMTAMLQAIVNDPTPGPSVQPAPDIRFNASVLSSDLRAALRKKYLAQYDDKLGSWGDAQKFLDSDSVEYALTQAQYGDTDSQRMARQTLTAQLKLLDPVWGGVYQYSAQGDWDHPHFEKIMAMQASNLRVYALAYAQWHDPVDLHAALAIRGYLHDFLTSPQGAFYTSQDADLVPGQHSAAYFALDDAARRKLGIPRIDQHIYARENSWAIEALATLYATGGDDSALSAATKAANWIIAHRSLPGGGFRHAAHDKGGPYLGDTLAMGMAELKLYAVTGDRIWLKRAQAAAGFIAAHFSAADGVGYVTAQVRQHETFQPQPLRAENVPLARFTNLLYHYTGHSIDLRMSQAALRYLASPIVAERFPAASVLMVDADLGQAPLHLTVAGAKDDSAAITLFRAAIATPGAYKRVEWWDRREGPLPNPDVPYPNMTHAAAYVCSGRRCSAPAFNQADLLARVQKLTKD